MNCCVGPVKLIRDAYSPCQLVNVSDHNKILFFMYSAFVNVHLETRIISVENSQSYELLCWTCEINSRCLFTMSACKHAQIFLTTTKHYFSFILLSLTFI